MGVYDALGPAGGAAGVEDDRDVVGGGVDLRRTGFGCSQRGFVLVPDGQHDGETVEFIGERLVLVGVDDRRARPESSRTCATSSGASRMLTGTATSPALASPNEISGHSMTVARDHHHPVPGYQRSVRQMVREPTGPLVDL